jgi:hypothetical protein
MISYSRPLRPAASADVWYTRPTSRLRSSVTLVTPSTPSMDRMYRSSTERTPRRLSIVTCSVATGRLAAAGASLPDADAELLLLLLELLPLSAASVRSSLASASSAP